MIAISASQVLHRSGLQEDIVSCFSLRCVSGLTAGPQRLPSWNETPAHRETRSCFTIHVVRWRPDHYSVKPCALWSCIYWPCSANFILLIWWNPALCSQPKRLLLHRVPPRTHAEWCSIIYPVLYISRNVHFHHGMARRPKTCRIALGLKGAYLLLRITKIVLFIDSLHLTAAFRI